jgi:hypothetical protein
MTEAAGARASGAARRAEGIVPGVGGVLRRNGAAMAAGAALTVAVQAGGLWLGAGREPTLSVLVATVWVMLAAPVFAASGTKTIDSLLRAAAVIDAGIVYLLIVWQRVAPATFGDIVRIYLLWAAIGLCLGLLATIPRRAANRYAAAVAGVVAAMIVAAGPFWASGWLATAQGEAQRALAWWVMAADPLVMAGRVWEYSAFTRPLLYDYSALARDVPPQGPAWYATVLLYAGGALAAGAAAWLWRSRSVGAGAG